MTIRLSGFCRTSRTLPQTKGAETDMLSLPRPRHISTLPEPCGSIAVLRTTGIVKGFRTPARRRREGIHGGRRPKSLEGGNRGGVCAGSGVGLWGFSAGACPDLSVSNRDDG